MIGWKDCSPVIGADGALRLTEPGVIRRNRAETRIPCVSIATGNDTVTNEYLVFEIPCDLSGASGRHACIGGLTAFGRVRTEITQTPEDEDHLVIDRRYFELRGPGGRQGVGLPTNAEMSLAGSSTTRYRFESWRHVMTHQIFDRGGAPLGDPIEREFFNYVAYTGGVAAGGSGFCSEAGDMVQSTGAEMTTAAAAGIVMAGTGLGTSAGGGVGVLLLPANPNPVTGPAVIAAASGAGGVLGMIASAPSAGVVFAVGHGGSFLAGEAAEAVCSEVTGPTDTPTPGVPPDGILPSLPDMPIGGGSRGEHMCMEPGCIAYMEVTQMPETLPNGDIVVYETEYYCVAYGLVPC